MASVYKRGNVWWVRFQWKGEEVRQSARTTSKAEAREYLAQLQAQYRQLDIGGRPRVSFRDAAAAYIQEDVSRRKVSTIAFYQKILRALDKEFGENFLDEITRYKISAYEAKLLRRLAPSSVQHRRATLSGVFRTAIRHDWVDRNPCRDLDSLKVQNDRFRFLSEEEWGLLKAALPEPQKSIAEMSVLRGMRAGEILALKWGDIDWRRDLITIRDTKGNRPRVIPLEGAADVLKRQPTRKGYIFPNDEGEARRVDNLTKTVNRVARDEGIEDFTFHDLRHTFASWYVQRGGDLYRLQRILGHKGPAMTQRYAHLRTDDLREVAQKSAHPPRDFLH